VVSDDDLTAVRRLLQAADQGDGVSRLRRARHSLIHTNPSAHAIEHVGLESAALALARALEISGLPLAAQRCQQLATSFRPVPAGSPAATAQLNAWVYPRSLRLYQQQILDGNPSDVLIFGQRYGLRGCRADEDRNHLLLEDRKDGSLWWWPSGECGEGYLLTDQPLSPAEHASGCTGWERPTLVRTGNSNFAHFLWNELDPLLRLIQANRRVAVVQDSDTVLNLAHLEGVIPAQPGQLASHPSVRLGGTLVTAQARHTVLAAMATPGGSSSPPGRPQPLILLGIRGPGRRELVNEHEVMVALIDALCRRFHNPLILLDGFTYQHNNRQQAQAQQREQACTARVQAIMRACPQAQLENLSGLDISTWLQRTEGVRFYVTHEGTMHHKLGWLRPEIPSLCLVGSVHAAAIVTWHRKQCEGAGPIATLPVELFRQQPRPADQPESEERNQPFELLAIPQAVALILREITAQLELTTP
jgi:hypothetical protein